MADKLSFRPEQVHKRAFIAPGAVVLGDVTIGEQSSVWFSVVIRGDNDPITIGNRTNVQDGCILHADPGFLCTVGDRVTLGHGAIVHGATVEDDVLIGMRAVVMNGARIGSGSIVGVGAVVTEGTEVPPGSMVLGLPASVRRETTEEERASIRRTAENYVRRAEEFRK